MSKYLNLKTPKIPRLPGVYFFKDGKGKILYIGKAADLRNRLHSYFSKSAKDVRVLNMLKEADKVSWQKTGSEIEALILESQLIKKHRPQFNILMRDDKQYSYVVFTKEVFPKIRITHQPSFRESSADTVSSDITAASIHPLHPDPGNQSRRFPRFTGPPPLLGSEGICLPPSKVVSKTVSASFLLGPFTDVGALKVTLKLLRRIFPYCTCKEKHNNYCLNYHLENCPGYCCLKESHSAPSLSADRHSERGRAWSETRNSNLKLYTKNIKAIKDILLGKKTSVVKKLEKEMKEAAKKNDFIKAIGLRNKTQQLKWVFENARVIRQMEEQNKALRELWKVFDLPTFPKRIEAYDVSHIQGADAVGSMAVFTDGKPDKKEYRKFKLFKSLNPDDSVSGPRPKRRGFKLLNSRYGTPTQKGGDTGMLKEMLVRRFRHQEWPMPDLIIVDGGKAQLNAALEALNFKSLNFKLLNPASQTRIIALTKNKKHRPCKVITLSKGKPWTIGKLPKNAQNLLISVNSEAHRFAIGYHRKLRRRLGGPAS